MRFCLSALLAIVTCAANAQDLLIMRFTTDTFNVRILEITPEVVKYKFLPEFEDMPVITESREKIKKIIFRNGTQMRLYDDDYFSVANYSDQRKQIIKIEPLAIMRGVTSLSYEKSVKPGRSIEFALGIIGLGFHVGDFLGNNFTSANGMLIRVGYKFINTPDYYMKGMQYMHILKGSYIKPELVILSHTLVYSGTFSVQNGNTYTYTSKSVKDEYRISGGSLMLNFGKQWVFDDVFVVDIYAGIGIGEKTFSVVNLGTSQIIPYHNYNENGLITAHNYGAFGFGSPFENYDFNFTGQCGLRVGFLFGKKGEKK